MRVTEASGDDYTSKTIEDFRKSWEFVRGMTSAFMNLAPLEAYPTRPNSRYGTLAQQFRHMIQVTDLYRSALEQGQLVPEEKFASYSGSLERDQLLTGLERADRQFLRALEAFPVKGFLTIKFGDALISLGEFLDICIEHEANHHGLWSTYASHAGFETPESWRQTWDI